MYFSPTTVVRVKAAVPAVAAPLVRVITPAPLAAKVAPTAAVQSVVLAVGSLNESAAPTIPVVLRVNVVAVDKAAALEADYKKAFAVCMEGKGYTIK